MTVHDLFFLKHPEMTSSAEIRRDYVPLVRDHVRRADGVICVSRATPRREIRRLLDVPAEKIAVIPNGVDPVFREPVPQEEVDGRARPTLPAARRHPLRGQRREAEEPRQPGHGLHGARAAARTARLPPSSSWAPARTGRRAATISGPQIRATGYLETREIRALMAASLAARAPLPRGGLRPARGRGHGRRPARRLLAGLRPRGGRGRRRHPGGPARPALDRRTGSSASSTIRAYAARSGSAGLARSRRFDWDQAAAQTLEFYRTRPRPLSAGVRSWSASTPASSRDGPPAPAATCVTSCGLDGTRPTTFVALLQRARSSRGPPRTPSPARARARGQAGQRTRLAGTPAARGRAGGRAGRLLLARLLVPALPRPPARHRRPRPLVLLTAPGLRVPRRPPPPPARVPASLRASPDRARLLRVHAPRDRRPVPRPRRPRGDQFPSGPTTTCRLRPPRPEARARLGVAGPARRHGGRDPEPASAAGAPARPTPASDASSPTVVLDVVGENRTHPRLDLEARARQLGLARSRPLLGIRRTTPASPTATPRPMSRSSCPSTRASAFPPLEAAVRGVPVVASDRPSLGEIFGDAALLVDPRDEHGDRRGPRSRAHGGRALRADLVARGRALAARYSWAETAAPNPRRPRARGRPMTRRLPDRRPAVSAVVVSYNTREDLLSLPGARWPSRSASPSRSSSSTTRARTAPPTAARAELPRALVHRERGEPGLRRRLQPRLARLVGARTCSSSTATPRSRPGAVEALAGLLDARPDVGVVGPRTLGADGRIQVSFGPDLTPLAEWRQRRLVRGVRESRPGALRDADAPSLAGARAGLGLGLLPARPALHPRGGGWLRRGLLPLRRGRRLCVRASGRRDGGSSSRPRPPCCITSAAAWSRRLTGPASSTTEATCATTESTAASGRPLRFDCVLAFRGARSADRRAAEPLAAQRRWTTRSRTSSRSFSTGRSHEAPDEHAAACEGPLRAVFLWWHRGRHVTVDRGTWRDRPAWDLRER